MEMISVHWKNGALDDFTSIASWYRATRSDKAAEKFIQNIQHSIDLLAQNPYMGHSEDELSIDSALQYRSFVTHPHYKIIYHVDDNNHILHIVAVWDCRRNSANLIHTINR